MQILPGSSWDATVGKCYLLARTFHTIGLCPANGISSGLAMQSFYLYHTNNCDRETLSKKQEKTIKSYAVTNDFDERVDDQVNRK